MTEEVVDALADMQVQSEVDWLQTKVLGHRLKFTLKDAREVTGLLQCLDFQGNSVLTSCEEVVQGLHREIGQVVIPAKALVKVELIT